MGVHQKIDRVARRYIKKQLPASVSFPLIREILHFEGLNGPDGIKRKSPAKDEPWHYIDPSNPDDVAVFGMVNDHIRNLAAALYAGDTQRAAFEAAWMAHAVTDSMTPAHHYPLEAKLEELRGGQGLETRTTKKSKLILPGNTRRSQLYNNWEFWGAKGVMTTHLTFELGIATTIAPLRFEDSAPTKAQFDEVRARGFEVFYREAIGRIAAMEMYDEFSKLGWTRHLAKETKSSLLPEIIQMVTLGWYQAVVLAEEMQRAGSNH